MADTRPQFGTTGTAGEMDPAKLNPRMYRTILENDRLRVMEAEYQPGARMPVHSHPDFAVYVVSGNGGKLRVTTSDGNIKELDTEDGAIVWFDAETHESANVGTVPVRLLVIELNEPRREDS